MSAHATDAQKSDWHKRDEEFIQHTLAGKEQRAHQPKGGKPADMPLTMHSDNPATTDAQRRDWHQRDEEFIQHTLAGKEQRAHQPKGGKPEDMPLTMPSDNPDYGSRPATTDAQRSDWHQRDEEFVQDTLAGKEMRAHRSKDGRPSDYPEHDQTGSQPFRSGIPQDD